MGAFLDSTMLYQGPDTVGVPCLLTMHVSILTGAYCEDDCVTLSALAGNDPGFTVYPNPAGSHLTIESRKPMALITIYGVDGRKWMSLEARTATRYVINCKELAAGVYFIEVKGTDGSVGISRIVLTE